MSDPGSDLPGIGGPSTPPPSASSNPPARAASMRLRDAASGEQDSAAMLDPANQSLADALQITYRLMQVAMVILVGLFCLSGFQTVQENERGVRLLFGEVSADNLEPGFQFSFPYPMGELLRVDTGATTVELEEAFWPRLSPEQRAMGLEQLANAGKRQLKPGEDGSLVTGDESIVHTRWKIVYRRGAGEGRSVAKFVQNVLPEHEQRLVRSAVQRGVVQAVAQTSIDDLLKQSSADGGSIVMQAKQIAQSSLDHLNAGIVIEQLTLQDKAPPFNLYTDFTRVQSSQQQAGAAREKAEAEARRILNGAAGAAHQPLITLIGEFEAASERGDKAGSDAAMASINRVMEGEAVILDGKTIEKAAAGEVTTVLNGARQYRSSIVSKRRAEVETFRAKLGQFKQNPLVVTQRDWADAYEMLLRRKTTEIFYASSAVDELQVLLSRDPAFEKEIERAKREYIAERGKILRERQRDDAIYKIDTDRKQVEQ